MSSPMYHEFASEYDTAIRENLYNAKFERPSLLSLLPNVHGKSVLDLGCGPGVYAQELVDKGAKVTAIDSSESMIEITQSKIGTEHTVYRQDLAEGLPNEKSNTYDIVICPLTIHYIKDLSALFSDIKRVLKCEGVFIFSTNHPNVDFNSSPSGNYFETEQITEHWQTLGRPITVSYYRRPINALASTIASAGMFIANISEGTPTSELKAASEKVYKKLSTKPSFMFYTCQKNFTC